MVFISLASVNDAKLRTSSALAQDTLPPAANFRGPSLWQAQAGKTPEIVPATLRQIVKGEAPWLGGFPQKKSSVSLSDLVLSFWKPAALTATLFLGACVTASSAWAATSSGFFQTVDWADLAATLMPMIGLIMIMSGLWLTDRRRLMAEADWCAFAAESRGRYEARRKVQRAIRDEIATGRLPTMAGWIV